MNQYDLQHGNDWHGQDVSGWYGSEKLDGCRAYWTGSELRTRTGMFIDPPYSFIRRLPDGYALDGEIWAGRGNLQLARKATQYGSKHWTHLIRFVAFDSPSVSGDWQDRLEAIRSVWTDTVECFTVRNVADVLERLQTVQSNGGEGLVLRDPSVTRYMPGRSGAILKVKTAVTISAADISPSRSTD